MPSEEFIVEFLANLPTIIIRVFAIGILIMHIFFSIVIVRQTKIMTKIVEAKISPTIVLITSVHLLASFAVLAWAIIFI